MSKEFKEPLFLENVKIMYKNFSGKAGPNNSEGNRNFTIILDQDLGEKLMREGWDIIYKPSTDEYPDPQYSMRVSISYRDRYGQAVAYPAKASTVVNGKVKRLDEGTISSLDRLRIDRVSLILNPRPKQNDPAKYKGWVREMVAFITVSPLDELLDSFENNSNDGLDIDSDFNM